jgi:hypothetical protein
VKKEKLVLQKQPIWDRQPGETPIQFMWFGRYLEERLNGGSMADVCKKHGKKPGYAKVLGNWAYPGRWTERIEAYRDFLDRQRQQQRLKDIEEMGDRQAKNGVLLQQMGIKYFQELMQKDEPVKLSAETAMRYIETGSRIERTARGAPTEIRSEVELPEETRKRMEALYAETMEESNEIVPENILRQNDFEEEPETGEA